MGSSSSNIQVRINSVHATKALIDSGCDCYAVVSEDLVTRLSLLLVEECSRPLRGYSEEMKQGKSSGVAVLTVEICGFEEEVFAYVVPGLSQDLFLGNPWMARNKTSYNAGRKQLWHGRAGLAVRLVRE